MNKMLLRANSNWTSVPSLGWRAYYVPARWVPDEVKRDFRHLEYMGCSSGWNEVAFASSVVPDCGYGCKLYARRFGAVVRYAVFHSSTYGCKKAAA